MQVRAGRAAGGADGADGVAAGDGVASAGKTLALSMARQGLAVYSYNSYQSVIRGGHSYLRLRISAKKPLNQGDQVDILIALNQDTLDRSFVIARKPAEKRHGSAQ